MLDISSALSHILSDHWVCPLLQQLVAQRDNFRVPWPSCFKHLLHSTPGLLHFSQWDACRSPLTILANAQTYKLEGINTTLHPGTTWEQ